MLAVQSLLDVRSSSPSWQLMASAESARRYHAVAAVGDFSIMMLGGWEADFQATDTAQLSDARADRWNERAEWRLPAPSSDHCATVIA